MNEDVLDMLRTERECVSRDCDRVCGRCDLAQERQWLLDRYDRAIELLTPVEPKANDKAVLQYGWTIRKEYLCGACGHSLVAGEKWQTKFCPNCGKAVKWQNG